MKGTAIILKTGDEVNEYSRDVTPEGLTFEDRKSVYMWKGEKQEDTYQKTLYPELGDGRLYAYGVDVANGVVVPINGRTYRVFIAIDYDWNDSIPESATVTFFETENAETEHEVFDRAAHRQKHIDRLREGIGENEKAVTEFGADDMEYLKSVIAESYLEIEQLESGEDLYRHGAELKFFGQPEFIQNEMMPVYNGRLASHLATIETGWGDSGNVNILVSCDDDGVPVAVWFEASCC